MPLRERRRLVSSGIGRPEGKESSVFHSKILFLSRKSNSDRSDRYSFRITKVFPPPSTPEKRNYKKRGDCPSDRKKSPDEDDERRENDPTSITGNSFSKSEQKWMSDGWRRTELPPSPSPPNHPLGMGEGGARLSHSFAIYT